MKPQPKVAAGGVGGAVATLLIFIAGACGLQVPPEAAAAVSTLAGFAAAYLKGT